MCWSSKKNEKDVEMLKTLMSLKTMDTRRSTTGYLFKLNDNITSRKSQRQSTFSLSSTEAENMGLSAATQEATRLKRLLKEFKIYPEETVLIHQDNQGAIALAKNPVFHQRAKHIDIRYHFVREMIETKQLTFVLL